MKAKKRWEPKCKSFFFDTEVYQSSNCGNESVKKQD